MAPTRGRLEGRVTVPTGGWTGTIDDSGGASAATWTVAAGTYYLSSGADSYSLIDAFAAALNSAAPTDTIAVTLSAGESGTGKVTITSTGSTAIAFTSTDLRDLLGFETNLSAGTSWTGTMQARSLWLPNCPYKAPNGVGVWRGWREADARSVENAAGYVFNHMGQEKEVNELSWNSVSRSLIWAANEATVNASWERFARDCIWGVAAWGTPGGPLRFYPDAADSGIYATYKVPGYTSIRPEPLIQDYVAGTWRVVLPRLVVDPGSVDDGLPRDAMTLANLLRGSWNADLATYTTGAFTPTAESLVILSIASGITSTTSQPVTTVTGAGITWSKIAELDPFTTAGSNPAYSLSVWAGLAPAAPTSDTLSIAFGSTHTGRIAWNISEVTDGFDRSGVNGAGAIVQTKTATSGGAVLALSAMFDNPIEHPSNLTFAVTGSSLQVSSPVPASGFTSLGTASASGSTPTATTQMYKLNSITGGFTSIISCQYGLILIEIKAAVS